MKIVIVVGARPNFMKAAPIMVAIRQFNERVVLTNGVQSEVVEHVLVHTGQHYDALMSDTFFADLNLPAPDVMLGVGSGSHAIQTAETLKGFEGVLLRERPDIVIVVGDVNSTVGCALATAKISFDTRGTRPLLAHVEAGLRSFDRVMPEEINRLVTDHISDILFVTEESGLQNLRNEGVSDLNIHFVGNTMIDSLLAFQEKADASDILKRLRLQPTGDNGQANTRAHYGLITLHRPSNVDDQDTFVNILAGLAEFALDWPLVFPVHPRTRQRIQELDMASKLPINIRASFEDAGLSSCASPGVTLIDPLGYLEFLCLMKHATLVITDSGGIQEETTCLGIPCVTVRDNTERPVTLECGTNRLAGTTKEKIAAAIKQQLARGHSGIMPTGWDGRAASRILDVLIEAHRERVAGQPQAATFAKPTC